MNLKFFRLLSVSRDAKTVKGEKEGVLTAILYMAPSDQSGVINVCPHASPGCRAACLFSAGRGRFANVIQARTARTLSFASDRAHFLKTLEGELRVFEAIAAAQGLRPAVRLNGTSDLPYEKWGIFPKFPGIAFYDYTKSRARFARFLNGEMPENYSLTFSRSETNGKYADAFLKAGGNVAIVFAGKTLPTSYNGKPVVNGDENDLRFRDKRGVVVGLLAKGRAIRDETGFAVQVPESGVVG